MEKLEEKLKGYEQWLYQQELSENTIKSYMYTARHFVVSYQNLSAYHLRDYKKHLITNYRPSTVNARIQAINKFAEYLNKRNLQLKTVKMQNRYYIDNVISNAELHKFQQKLLDHHQIKYYMIVRTLVCTAARISEALLFQIEDVQYGYAEILGKYGKIRRIYFPKTLRSELLQWCDAEGRTSGSLFLNKNGVTISSRGVETMLRRFAKNYGINPDVVHPHSYRHRYAINFLKRKPKEIIALADILGHSSIDTTRIYTRLTANEQYALINSVVNW